MRNALSFIILLVSLASCNGGGDSAASLTTSGPVHSCSTLEAVGKWQDPINASRTLEIYDDCSAYQNYCNQNIDFALPNQDNGLTNLTINTANLNGGCQQPGSRVCTVNVINNDTQLEINCAAESVNFIYNRAL